jgi:hypothetical protein
VSLSNISPLNQWIGTVELLSVCCVFKHGGGVRLEGEQLFPWLSFKHHYKTRANAKHSSNTIQAHTKQYQRTSSNAPTTTQATLKQPSNTIQANSNSSLKHIYAGEPKSDTASCAGIRNLRMRMWMYYIYWCRHNLLWQHTASDHPGSTA